MPSPHDCVQPGFGGQLASYAQASSGFLVGFRAPATLEAPVQRQAQFARKLDPAVNQVPAVSTPQAAGSGLSAARRGGRVRPCASTATSP